ncbi:hypothetical protein DICA2_D06634 [Diutina catenulata]
MESDPRRFDHRQLSEVSKHQRHKLPPPPLRTAATFAQRPAAVISATACPALSAHLRRLGGTHGAVTGFECTPVYLVFAFASGWVYGFDYRQQPRFALDAAAPVSAVAVSADSAAVAVGTHTGEVHVWNLAEHFASSSSASSSVYTSREPWHTVAPVPSLRHRFSRHGSGHLAGVPITQLMFLHQPTQLVAADRSGLVFYHHLVRARYSRYFAPEHRFPTASAKVWGTNDVNADHRRHQVLAAAVLPLGNTHQITDDLAVVAVLTRTQVAVVSVLSLNLSTKPAVRVHYQAARAHPAHGGCLDWFPCMAEGTSVANARMCYGWDQTVVVAEVDNRAIAPNWVSVVAELKDKDRAVPPIMVRRTARWRSRVPVAECRWISRELVVVGNRDVVVILYYDGESLVEVISEEAGRGGGEGDERGEEVGGGVGGEEGGEESGEARGEERGGNRGEEADGEESGGREATTGEAGSDQGGANGNQNGNHPANGNNSGTADTSPTNLVQFEHAHTRDTPDARSRESTPQPGPGKASTLLKAASPSSEETSETQVATDPHQNGNTEDSASATLFDADTDAISTDSSLNPISSAQPSLSQPTTSTQTSPSQPTSSRTSQPTSQPTGSQASSQASPTPSSTPSPSPWFLRVCKHRVIELRDSRLTVGTVVNWADWLGQLLLAENDSEAFGVATQLYHLEDPGLLALFDLSGASRHELLRPFLLRIMVSPRLDARVADVVAAAACLAVDSAKPVPELEQVLQTWFDRAPEPEFFAALEPHVLSGALVQLSPQVLQALVKFYVARGDGVLLTELLCRLDLATLDIDLTLRLAEEHGLHECMVYVWTTLLKDYHTPLFKFYHSDDRGNLYTYMSYILTGRQYPTDQFIASAAEEAAAKSAIVEVVFATHILPSDPGSGDHKKLENGDLYIAENGLSGSDDGDEPSGAARFHQALAYHPTEVIFPYLTRFLHRSARDMLRTLNEFFEDPSLNSGRLSRQYIVDALVDIFDTDNTFTDDDRTQMAVFLARNYPKYTQFLRLSESQLASVVTTLLASPPGPDVELALQSVLAVYTPQDPALLVSQLHARGFFRVLSAVYRRQGHYGKVLEMWLQRPTHDESMESMLESAFRAVKGHPTQRRALITTITDHLSEIVNVDVEGAVRVFDSVAPEVHDASANLEPHRQFLYLHQLRPTRGKLVAAYVRLSAQYDADHVYEITCRRKSQLTLSEVESELRDAGLFDSVAELCDDFDTLLSLLSTSVDSPGVVFSRVLSRMLSLCQADSSRWLAVINLLVSFSEPHPETISAVHECFRAINRYDQTRPVELDHESTFISVLRDFLAESDTAPLATIRGVLQEVVVSYAYEREMAGISLRMLDGHIAESTARFVAETKKGWLVARDPCTYCAKPLWQRPAQYLAWQKRRIDELEGKPRGKVDETDSVVVFECGHGYHGGCLAKLNGDRPVSDPACVVCVDKLAARQ